MQLNLNEQETEIVKRLLDDHLLKLSHQIHKAASREFRHALEEEETVVKALVARF